MEPPLELPLELPVLLPVSATAASTVGAAPESKPKPSASKTPPLAHAPTQSTVGRAKTKTKRNGGLDWDSRLLLHTPVSVAQLGVNREPLRVTLVTTAVLAKVQSGPEDGGLPPTWRAEPPSGNTPRTRAPSDQGPQQAHARAAFWNAAYPLGCAVAQHWMQAFSPVEPASGVAMAKQAWSAPASSPGFRPKAAFLHPELQPPAAKIAKQSALAEQAASTGPKQGPSPPSSAWREFWTHVPHVWLV